MKIKNYIATVIIVFSAGSILNGQSKVTIEEKPLVIPTYQVAPPDKNPVFYTGRNYQGAQGHVYPHPLYDVLTDVRSDKSYDAVYINNEYLELCVIPELGGRIFSATDKSDQYDFFYRQHVIKPTLIGMTGAWISGGVEWNIPDHHRATSNLPIDHTISENADGSKTVWVGETEISRGLKWIVGLTVYPGKSYVEATVRIFNPTRFSHPFLYWANVSVHCDENYQVIFPPNTQFGVQHAKNEFTTWPLGSDIYAGIDRTGIDLSWWKNHPNPASIFAWNFSDDFLAGYDFGKDAGTVHVANHHIVTGKKFFLWGNNPEAEMWEKMLTETDGQYLELMVGAYSDNQPDYSWIAPGETREFKQYWYPVKKIGGVKNANTNAAINLERKAPGSVVLGLYTTTENKKSRLWVTSGEKTLLDERIDIDPANPFMKEISIDPVTKDTDIKVSLFDAKGNELISYKPTVSERQEMPDPVEVPKSPKEYNTIEELYYTGLRTEQFRNAVIDPLPYYLEALSRDSLDYRVNTILGIRYCKEGRYAEAEKHLRSAIKRNTKNYTRPKDGEAFYYLGVVLQLQNRLSEAADQYWKATWYNGFQSTAYYGLAQIACREQKLAEARELIEKSLATNNLNVSALTFKAWLLRKSGEFEDARQTLKVATGIDKLDNWCESELSFLRTVSIGQQWDAKSQEQFRTHMNGNLQYVLELAKNYGSIGAYDDAVYVLELFKKQNPQSGFPLLAYYQGFYLQKAGKKDLSETYFIEATAASPDYCFPWRLEEIEVLETLLKIHPEDARAWYYLGNLHYYLNQKENALRDWEQSVKLDENFSNAWRNLGFAYNQVSGDLEKSLDAYEKAILLNDQDPRLFAEIDVIREKAGITPSARLTALLKHLPVVSKRDDAITRVIELYNLTGSYDKALKILNERHFHVWEGHGSIHDIFEDANLLQGITYLEKGQFAKALNSFQQADTYPDNLEVGAPIQPLGNVRINYYMALAYKGMNREDMATELFNKSAQYNDRWNQPELKYYKALALKQLGKQDDANAILDGISEYALEMLRSSEGTDFFAKFGENVRQESRISYNYYIVGLTFLAKGDQQQANLNFQKSVELDQSQLWAKKMQQLKIKL